MKKSRFEINNLFFPLNLGTNHSLHHFQLAMPQKIGLDQINLTFVLNPINFLFSIFDFFFGFTNCEFCKIFRKDATNFSQTFSFPFQNGLHIKKDVIGLRGSH